jgi:hypothetical protein
MYSAFKIAGNSTDAVMSRQTSFQAEKQIAELTKLTGGKVSCLLLKAVKETNL